ncbi:MAG: radical SAM protein [Chloroflexi bacterium]|nr:radical SAM protein [Chloroflexota bacterium]
MNGNRAASRSLRKIKELVLDTRGLNAVPKWFHLRRALRFPIKVGIETSSLCNLKCIMCPNPHLTRRKGNLDFALYRKIVDEVTQHPVEGIILCNYGEPLLNPAIFDMVRYAKDRGIREVRFNSNGTLLDEEAAERLIASGLDAISISMEGAREETYQRIRVNAKYQVVTENLRRLMALKGQRRLAKPRVVLQTIRMRDNLEELDVLCRDWQPVVDEVQITNFVNFSTMGGRVPDRRVDPVPQKRCPCLFLWERMTIFSDGRVPFCGCDADCSVAVGDVNDQSLQDIWRGEGFQAARAAHQRGDYASLPLCADCPDWSRRRVWFLRH